MKLIEKDLRPFSARIEASLEELSSLVYNVTEVSQIDAVYTEVLLAYLKGNASLLNERIDHLSSLVESDPEAGVALALTKLRLNIRQWTVKDAQLNELLDLSAEHPKWRGEIHFVAAMGFGQIEDYANELKNYQIAVIELEKIGAHRKALKAAQNALAAQSSITPEARQTMELHHLLRKAKRIRDFSVAGLTTLNLSREYQSVGSRRIALKFANQAIVFFRKDLGSLHYYLALAHRCHLLIETGRLTEAVIDYEQCQISEFPEIHAALALLSPLLPEAPEPIPETEISRRVQAEKVPTWRERASDIQQLCKNEQPASANVFSSIFGPVEEQLLCFISSEPRTRQEIISHLYGDKVDYEALENRFKNTLARIRKKAPGLILCENGRYYLADADRFRLYSEVI